MPIFDRYEKLRKEIDCAATASGRDPASILLLAVSKGYPLNHVLPAYDAGCRDFGENKVQEALEKIPSASKDIRWHLIGTLQRNKVRKVIGKFHLIHSVDSVPLAKKISLCSDEANLVTPVLLQLKTSKEKTKHGFTPKELEENIDHLTNLKGIALKGLMTMAPFTDDEKTVRSCFLLLRELRDRLQRRIGNAAQLKELSMGMTNDWRLAVQEGATILRIGTAIFGRRESP